MKKIIASLAVLLCISVFGYAQETKTSKIEFKTLEHNFGKLDYKGNATCEFEFTNKGDAPLILTSVSASCGCTTPEWPKTPILPGKTGVIKVTYDSQRVGAFTKMVYVYSNAPQNMITLKIFGEILAPK